MRTCLIRHTMVVGFFCTSAACYDFSQPWSGDGGPVSPTPPTAVTLCVYTARDDTQWMYEVESFHSVHPEIKLECPGVEAEVLRQSTQSLLDTLVAERDGATEPTVDVIWGLAVTHLLDIDDMIVPYAPADLEKVDSDFVDPNYPSQIDEPAWVGIDAFMAAFCVPSTMSDPPESWSDLLDPAYQGLISMPSPESSGTGLVAVAGLLISNTDPLTEDPTYDEVAEGGWDYLEALDANILEYTSSGSAPCRYVAGTATPVSGGTVTIGITFDGGVVEIRDNQNEDVQLIFPSEGVGYSIAANALIDKPDIKPEARLFLDWALSYEAMIRYAESAAIISRDIITTYPDGYGDDPKSHWVDMDLVSLASSRQSVIDAWLCRFGSEDLEENPGYLGTAGDCDIPTVTWAE